MRNFLQPDPFDLLPFDLLQSKLELRQAFSETTALHFAPEDYRSLLMEAIEDARENTFNGTRIPLLVEMIRTDVPRDVAGESATPVPLLERRTALSATTDNQQSKAYEIMNETSDRPRSHVPAERGNEVSYERNPRERGKL